MMMKRYQARDMRSALRQVREEQGPDAVILSTQTIVGGVEVCAATDDYTQAAQPVTTLTPAAAPRPPESRPAPLTAAVAGGERGESNAVSAELRHLRLLLERQMSALAWNDYTRREPQRAALLGELTRLGLARAAAWQLLAGLPTEALSAPQLTAESLLTTQLRTTRLPTEIGNAVALIGTPGSGKSTTLAKLAVRQVLEHGPDSLALITMDNTRLGAPEQTRSLARLLGVSVNVVVDHEELGLLVPAVQRKRLVLIDTAGVPLRDAPGMQELCTAMSAVPGLQTLLTLAVSVQDQVLVDVIRQFSTPQ